MSILAKVFGDANEKYIKKLQSVVEEINGLEKKFEGFSNEQLKEKTTELKKRISKSREPFSTVLDEALPEAFALAREAAKRTLNQRHFDVQLIGGIILHQGKIAEMKTGEGKTLAATLPIYLNALTGEGVHVVTVNDYLAKRDSVWMGQIYYALGMSVGCIVHDAAYIYDPTYKPENDKLQNTNDQNSKRDEIRDTVGGFRVVESYLRPCSRKEAYAADITYGTNNEFGFDYLRDNMTHSLETLSQRSHHYAIIDEVDSILIDEARTPLIISAPDQESSKWYQDFARIIPQLNQETDYQVDEKRKAVTLTEKGIAKVEEILGMGNIYEERGIKYVHHLEQALRAQVLFKKDRDYVLRDGEVIIVDEFTGRLMPGRRWSGGLHQAVEAKEGVRVQSESLTLASITFQNYFRMYEKLAGMTGTAATSAEEFDKVYNLEVVAIPTHKPTIRKDLADRVYKSQEGKYRAVVNEIKERHTKGQPVLVGTTSIEKNEFLGKLLDREGVPHQILNAKNHEKEGETIAQAGKLGAVTIATNMAGRGVDIVLGGHPVLPLEADKVREVGGLHVIGTERHEARRIDNQLRGRSGRQGDPGSSQFFISLEDDLMRIFGGEKIISLMGLLKIPEDQPIEAKMISGAIESAQSKIEGLHFDARKHVLEYDDVMNKHRETIYRKRKEFLDIGSSQPEAGQSWAEKFKNWLKSQEEQEALEAKIKELGENFDQVAKIVALRTLDMLWMNHLEEMESLRDSVRLRAYGQQDPLVEYKTEGHRMFKRLLDIIETNIVQTILKASLKPQFETNNRNASLSIQASRNEAKIGRNDPCPCGSGKKYKRCHGA